ncbi:MAG: DNA-3-methyladenine glycosylase [Bacteroidia bacterium]|nr:DNA-3-methyladenine glycosylase [Bacteroidia bacterium]MDW8332890.1 DNA-3-methyladenine glycosylase [Bacteroidia bacterium]
MAPLDPAFYLEQDVEAAATKLLGKGLFTRKNGVLTGGIITEAEAYSGRDDKACHAYNGRLTARNRTMYMTGGAAYVYLCYGVHWMLNVVTNREGVADAVLIRAVEPIVGTEAMMLRRGLRFVEPRLTAGPGALTRALGVERSDDGKSFWSSELFIADLGISGFPIARSKRIGVDYAGDDAFLERRFFIADNPFVSRRG